MKKWKSLLSFILILFTFPLCAKYLPPTAANDGMAVSEQRLASQVGADILNQGGNAIDAAVAMGYTLAVVDPCCGNIGGGGFMLIHLTSGKNVALDFRETAPEKISSELFFNNGKETKSSTVGYLSVGIPGTVMGLNTALKKYGTMSLKQVMAPAIHYAASGFPVTQHEISRIKSAHVEDKLTQDENMLKLGSKLKQPQLAKTLEAIRDNGTRYFYDGPIAKAIVAASEKNGGILTLNDFKSYHVIWRKPISCSYRGDTIVTLPPPSSGATICELLNILDGYSVEKMGFHSSQATHYNIEAMRYAFADRNQYLGDPAFVKNPLKKLLSKSYAQSIRAKIKPNQAGNSTSICFGNTSRLKRKGEMRGKNEQTAGVYMRVNEDCERVFNKADRFPVNSRKEKMQTTHYDVVDAKGNAVSVTYTLNGLFGSKQMAPGTGFFLNNELDDFTLRVGVPNQFGLVQGKANLIEPGKRPLSSMSPTMVFKNNKLYMVLGAAGGSTIITSIAEAIENVIDFKMNIQAAVNSTRYHMQWLPDTTFYEPYAFSADTLKNLHAMGYKMQKGIFGKYLTWGQMAAILIDSKTGEIYGANDARRPHGAAIGVSNKQNQWIRQPPKNSCNKAAKYSLTY